MAEQLDIEADPFLSLLTDALRAGPGSPEWHQAVTKLRNDGLNASSDHALLVSVREQLESGKSYRAVRAGPGFTRKLMENIDAEASTNRVGVPPARIIAYLGAVAIVIILAIVAILIGRGDPSGAGEIAKLRDAGLGHVVATASFDGAIPSGWTAIGSVPLDASAGLRPAATQVSGPYKGATLRFDGPIQPSEMVALEALVRPPTGPGTDKMVTQLVANNTSVDGEGASSIMGVRWILQGGKSVVVMPDGKSVGTPADFPVDPAGTLVRVAIGPTRAVVTVGGRELYAGEHGLSATSPRRLSISFLPAESQPREGIVLSARVVRP